MAYKLVITDEGDEKNHHQINYLVNEICNPDAASRLLDEIEKIYERLEDNPYQFEPSKDRYLAMLGYREAIITGMSYKVMFRVEDEIVYIMGTFHDKENYVLKLR